MYHIEIENESGKTHAPSSPQNLFQKTLIWRFILAGRVQKKYLSEALKSKFAFRAVAPRGVGGGVKGGVGSPRRRVSGADLQFSNFFQILDHSGRLQKMFEAKKR